MIKLSRWRGSVQIHPAGRFVRINFAPPQNPGNSKLILGEVEVWTPKSSQP